MTQSLALSILAVAEQIDGPESWVHLCITAAEEAKQAIMREPPLRGEARINVNDHLPRLMMRQALDRGELTSQIRSLVLQALAPISGETLAEAALHAASTAFRVTLPSISNRRSVQCFVACVAAGVLRGYLTAKDGNALLYVAQVALCAYPKRTTRKDKRTK